jgi:hypothetical protein
MSLEEQISLSYLHVPKTYVYGGANLRHQVELDISQYQIRSLYVYTVL